MSTGRGNSNSSNSSLQAAANSGRGGRVQGNNNYNRGGSMVGRGQVGGGGGRGGGNAMGMWESPLPGTATAAAAASSGLPAAKTAAAASTSAVAAAVATPSQGGGGGGVTNRRGGTAAGGGGVGSANSSPRTIPSQAPPPPSQQQLQQQQQHYYPHGPQPATHPYGMVHHRPHGMVATSSLPPPPGQVRYGMPPPNNNPIMANRSPYAPDMMMQPPPRMMQHHHPHSQSNNNASSQYYPAASSGMPQYPGTMHRSGSSSARSASSHLVGNAAAGPGGNAPTTTTTRRALCITDKHGNPIDLSAGKKKTTAPSGESSTAAARGGGAAAAAEKTTTTDLDEGANRDVGASSSNDPPPSSLRAAASSKSAEAGAALRRAAEEAIAAGSAKKAREEAEKQRKLKELEERRAEELRLALERKGEEERRAQEERERLDREEREREERERRAEAEARARKEAEERARKEEEERRRTKEEEAARAESLASSRAAAADPTAGAATTAAVVGGKGGTSGTGGGEKDEPPSRSGSGKSTSPAPPGGGFRPGGFRPGATRSAGGLRPGSASSASSTGSAAAPSERPSPAAVANGGRNGDAVVPGGSAAAGDGNGLSASAARRPFIYSKQMLLSLKDADYCVCKPEDLPDLTVRSSGGGGGVLRRQSSGRGNYGANRDGGGGGGGGGGGNQGDDWSRGREMSTPGGGGNRFRGGAGGAGGGRGGGGGDWDRGRAPPPHRAGRGGGGGPEQHHQPYPGQEIFTPLVRTENRWMPSKDNSAMAKVEKQVKSLLNKMSKEKFDKLSAQMCDIPILSYEMLTTVIKLVYEKAISEPSFSDMYASLCFRLSQAAKKGDFIKIIESDEDPMAEPGAEIDYSVEGGGSVSYRWSNDVSTSDAEIVGPFDDDMHCIDAALSNEDTQPVARGEMELTLHRLLIKRRTFIKIMHSPLDGKYYTVFFPISKAAECGQQLSVEIFTSEIEAQNHATKMNTFKRSLLNKCEDEFNKQDIYTDWKAEKKEYDMNKASLSEKEKAEKEEELEFRRMKIKKQMLGNIKFIGELYKLNMLKEKIMRFCIHHLLKLQEKDGGLCSSAGEEGMMDEEDHEALINLFKTIGEKIDNAKAQPYMAFYFRKIQQLTDDTTLSSRLRFAYSDLIDMRANGWKLRREVETAKSLDEIRKDAEREERMAQMQSQQGGGGRDAGRVGQRGNRDDNRNYDNRGPDRNTSYDNRGQDGGRGGGRAYDGGRGTERGGNDRDSFQSRDGGRGGRGDRDSNRGYDTRGSDRNAGFDSRGFDGGRGGGGGYGSRDAGFTPSRGSGPPPMTLARPPSVMGGGILPPHTGGVGGDSVLSTDQLKLRAQSMRKEWLQDPNEKELLMSIDEVIASPDAGKTIVQVNIDYAAVDCKASELKPIIDMILVLYKSKKVSGSDVMTAVGEVVEYIDSSACDNPQIYDYVGDMFSAFANENALTVEWLCECTSRISDESCKSKVIEGALKSIRKKYGDGAVHSCLMGKSERSALEKLLGPAKLQELDVMFG